MELGPLQKGQSQEDHRNLRLRKNKKQCCNTHTCAKLIFGFVFTFSLALCCIMWFTGLYWFGIQYKVTLRKDADIFPAWLKNPLVTRNCIYLFNYTNTLRFLNQKYPRLKIERVGPICLKEQPLKERVEFKKGDLVEYDDSRTLAYWPEDSDGNMSDIIVVPNFSLLFTTTLASNFIPPLESLLLSLIPKDSESQSLFLTMNISDYVNGWNDDVLNQVVAMRSILGLQIPFNRSGVIPWLYAFQQARMLAETGTRNTQQIGKLVQINGQPKLRLWGSKECNLLKGSDGAYFPPNDVISGNPVYFYYTPMCMSLKLTKAKEVELQENLMVPRYVVEGRTFAAPARNPENTCYCHRKESCYNMIDGLAPFDLEPCLGIPLLMTSPNLNLYSNYLLDHLEGYEMKATDPSNFDTFFDVIPNLGMTVRYRQVAQINLRVGRIKQFQNVIPNWDYRIKMLPLFYFNRSGDDLPKQLFRFMYEAQVTTAQTEFMLKWGSLSVAFLSGVVSIFLICRSIIAKIQKAQVV